MKDNISYDLSSLFFSLGCIPLLFLSKLPSTESYYYLALLLIVVVILYIFTCSSILRIIGFLLVGLLWSMNNASDYLTSINDYIDKNFTIRGIVTSLNLEQDKLIKSNNSYVNFDIQYINQHSISYPLSISLNWQNQILPSAGEEWQLNIKTKVKHSYLNEGGFDGQRFAIANKQLLVGTIEQANRLSAKRNLRQLIVDNILPYIDIFEHGGIMLALIFGERSKITADHKAMMLKTGIAHLMAISGMHILLVVFISHRIIRGLQIFLPVRYISHVIPLFFGLIIAICYGWLSGFNPPTIRAILVLLFLLLLKLKKISLSPWQIINRIIALLLFFNPLMILAESFWLTCYVVICLIFINQWIPTQRYSDRYCSYLLQLIKLQCCLSLLLLPIQFSIFNGMSASAIIANLFAIPIISFITLPAAFFMLILSIFNYFYLTIWFGVIVEQSLSLLFIILKPFTLYWIDISHSFYLLSGIGWCIMLTWRSGFYHSYRISIILICICMISPFFKRPSVIWRVDMLDVGHGLAIVISKGQSAIIYDTGAKWQDSSAAERVIIPFLIWHGLNLEGIIISHEHNDHIGGLTAIQQYYPKAWLMSSTMKLSNNYNCIDGTKFIWQQLKLIVLWPQEMKPAAFNGESCVIKLSDGINSILLTGDLEKKQEKILVSTKKNILFSTILQIPHHASNSSSTYTFLAKVSPMIAIGSVSRYNPWRLPSHKALGRYKNLAIDYYLTQNSGQISIFFYSDKWVIKQMRYEIKPRWYHDWFGTLPKYE